MVMTRDHAVFLRPKFADMYSQIDLNMYISDEVWDVRSQCLPGADPDGGHRGHVPPQN